ARDDPVRMESRRIVSERAPNAQERASADGVLAAAQPAYAANLWVSRTAPIARTTHLAHKRASLSRGASPGHGDAPTFDVPRWDSESPKTVRDALVRLGSTRPDAYRMFGTRDQVDPVRRSLAVCSRWS